MDVASQVSGTSHRSHRGTSFRISHLQRCPIQEGGPSDGYGPHRRKVSRCLPHGTVCIHDNHAGKWNCHGIFRRERAAVLLDDYSGSIRTAGEYCQAIVQYSQNFGYLREVFNSDSYWRGIEAFGGRCFDLE